MRSTPAALRAATVVAIGLSAWHARAQPENFDFLPTGEPDERSRRRRKGGKLTRCDTEELPYEPIASLDGGRELPARHGSCARCLRGRANSIEVPLGLPVG